MEFDYEHTSIHDEKMSSFAQAEMEIFNFFSVTLLMGHPVHMKRTNRESSSYMKENNRFVIFKKQISKKRRLIVEIIKLINKTNQYGIPIFDLALMYHLYLITFGQCLFLEILDHFRSNNDYKQRYNRTISLACLNSMVFVLTISFSLINLVGANINWNGNNWAMSCDFCGNDLSDVQISEELCGQRCAPTHGMVALVG